MSVLKSEFPTWSSWCSLQASHPLRGCGVDVARCLLRLKSHHPRPSTLAAIRTRPPRASPHHEELARGEVTRDSKESRARLVGGLLRVEPGAFGAAEADHLLRARRVDADDEVPLRQLQPRDEPAREPLRHFPGVGPQVVEADHALPVQVVDDDLGVALGLAVRDRVLQRRELRVVDLDVLFAEDLDCLLLRESDAPVLERREDRRRDVLEVHKVLAAPVQALREHEPLLDRHRRQLRHPVRHVAHRVHVRRARALVPRPDLAVRRGLDAHLVQLQLLRHRRAPDREQHRVKLLHELLLRVSVLVCHAALAAGRGLDLHGRALLDEAGAGGDHVVLDPGRGVAVEAAQHLRAHHD
eukprot:891446-Rhodomonas_salina.2